MTATSTLKLPRALARRIAPLAKKAGRTSSDWMLEAITSQAELVEEQAAFLDDAEKVVDELDAGGPLYASEEVHAYALALAAGKKARRPRPLPRTRK